MDLVALESVVLLLASLVHYLFVPSYGLIPHLFLVVVHFLIMVVVLIKIL
jgi:hypothetical protein